MNSVNVLNNTIYRSFPEGLIRAMNEINLEKVEEIRIRAYKPVIIKLKNNEIVLNYKMSIEEIVNCVQSFCSNSIYSYQNQICNGFITIPGGHRVRYKWKCCY